MFTFIANQLKNFQAQMAYISSASTVNGTGVDLGLLDGPIQVVLQSTTCGTAGNTLTYQIQTSPDNSAWTNLPAAQLLDTTGNVTTLTQGTNTVAINQVVALQRELLPRYIRVTATLAGTTPTVAVCVIVQGLAKYN